MTMNRVNENKNLTTGPGMSMHRAKSLVIDWFRSDRRFGEEPCKTFVGGQTWGV
jgi:hypothetical protein